MSRPSNRDIERHYFEMFRKDYSLPPGTITYKDAPDVILEGPKKIGIEITSFFHEDGAQPESEQTQRKLQEKVIASAEQMYYADTGRKIQMAFGFDNANPVSNQEALITKIVRLAKSIEGNQRGQIRKEMFETIPELSFVYVNPKEFPEARWSVVQVYQVPTMSRARLVEIVRSKERHANRYEKCDTYWLLVVVDFINPAQDQEIQIDDFAKIEIEVFEKVIVYKTAFGHILEAC